MHPAAEMGSPMGRGSCPAGATAVVITARLPKCRDQNLCNTSDVHSGYQLLPLLSLLACMFVIASSRTFLQFQALHNSNLQPRDHIHHTLGPSRAVSSFIRLLQRQQCAARPCSPARKTAVVTYRHASSRHGPVETTTAAATERIESLGFLLRQALPGRGAVAGQPCSAQLRDSGCTPAQLHDA